MRFIILALLIIVLTLMIRFENVSSYQCYKCEHPTDTTCLDPFNTTQLTLSVNYPVCVKAKGQLNGNDIFVRRGLTSDQVGLVCFGSRNGCIYRKNGSDNGEICCCTADRCNTGNTQLGKLHLIVLIAGGRFVLQLLF